MSAKLLRPGSLDEAVGALHDHAGAVVIGGGTDLVVHARSRRTPLPATLVSLDRVVELARVTVDGEGSLHLGAMVTHAQLEADPSVLAGWTALADAAAIIGSPATRHVGTLGGNLCNGSPAMELGGPLLAFGARVVLSSAGGTRTFDLGEFLLGPGKTALRPDELLQEVVVPRPPARSGSAYLRLGFRQAMEIAVVGAAAVLSLDGAGAVAGCAVALTAVAPRIVPAAGVAEALMGRAPSPELLAAAAARAAESASPIDDVRAPADYRRRTLAVVVRRTLETAAARVGG